MKKKVTGTKTFTVRTVTYRSNLDAIKRKIMIIPCVIFTFNLDHKSVRTVTWPYSTFIELQTAFVTMVPRIYNEQTTFNLLRFTFLET